MTIRGRGDTEARARGFDATLEAGFNWVAEHARSLLTIVGLAVLVGAGIAVSYEVRNRGENEAQLELAQVETGFARAMGGSPDGALALVSEPANQEQARRGREEALARFEAVALDHRGTRAAPLASLRAAEMEVDLERWPDAERRLAELVAELGAEDMLRAVALRLMGFAQEQQGRFAEAGESYEQAAQVEAYPALGALWVAAGASLARAGATERAIAAFQQVLSVDPELAEREGIVERLSELSAIQSSADF